MSESSTDRLLVALHASQDRLASTLGSVDEEQATAPSYDDGWTVADVASHLGSSAVIFTGHLASGRDGTPASGLDAAQVVWDEWNAKQPAARIKAPIAMTHFPPARSSAIPATRLVTE